MPIQPSGTIALSDIQTEFGGSNPISLSEYYRGGLYVTSNNTSVPTSGTISLSNFYGAVKQFSYTFSSSAQEVDLNSTLTTAGWNGSDPVVVTVASGVYLWSDSTSVGGLTISSALNGLLTITNNGYIIGRGGNGGGGNGGPALVNNATGVTLTNASGAFIAGGGGGGGGGGGAGGAGGGYGSSFGGAAGGAGGAIGQSGSDGGVAYYGGLASQGGDGGGAGGGGGNFEDSGSGFISYGGGGGGGRILPGVGGVAQCNPGAFGYGGGAGGSGGNAGTTGCNNGNGGGGGWGAAGGASGGSGGAAISGTAIATYTNNGTVYGSTA